MGIPNMVPEGTIYDSENIIAEFMRIIIKRRL
jgi:hypothetical protein